MQRTLLALAGLLLAGAAACSSSDDPSPASAPATGASGAAGASGSTGLGGAAGAAGLGGVGGGAGAGGASGPCANDPDPPSAGTTCIEQVSGVARSLDGSALPANTLVTVCGVACFYGKTDATGAFTAKMGVNIVVSDYVTYVHGQPAFANLLTRLPADAAGPSIVLSQPLLVPPLPAPAVYLPEDGAKASTVTSGAITLATAAGTLFDLEVDDIAMGKDGRALRVVKVDVAKAPPFAASEGAVLLYALAPFSAKPSTPVGVLISETGGLPAGTAVELFVLDDRIVDVPSPAGKARVVATAHVSDDGKQIVTDPGQGLDVLTWVGVRKKK